MGNITGTTDQIVSELQQKLQLYPPTPHTNSPSIFEFERLRDFKIDWKKLLKGDTPPDDSFKDDISDLNTYFVNSWKQVEKDPSIFEPTKLFTNLKSPDRSKYWTTLPVYFATGATAKAGDLEAIIADATGILCLIHKPSNRLYAFFDATGMPMAETRFDLQAGDTNEIAWKKFYQKGGLQLRMVFEKTADAGSLAEAKISGTSMEYVRRDGLYFKEEYKRLISQLEFLKWVISRIDGTSPPTGAAFTSFMRDIMNEKEDFGKLWNDSEFFDNTSGSFVNFKAKEFSVREKIRQLAAKVKEDGFYLCLGAESITVPGSTTPITLREGEIYQISKRRVFWATQHIRYELVKVKLLFVSFYIRRPIVETVWHTTVIDDFKLVDVSKDPVQSLIAELKTKKKNVYILEKKSGGYVTDSGELGSDILKKCENDEAFRKSCVVLVPEYDFIISNQTYYVGAFVFYNPLPGMTPARFPTVGFREELSYRMVWDGTELGQLISSINLAPGETRSIIVSSKFSQTTSQTASFRSVNDVSTSDNFDLATEFQTEASREFNRTDSFSASASGGFGIGPFSASASASGSRSTNLKTFSREMNKVAKKVSRSINRKMSQEITTTTSSSTTVSQESSRSAQITNINQGSTLNLLFYQINNRYVSALYLVDLEIMVGATTELIAGSGLYETYSFRLHELDKALEKLDPTLLPGDVQLDPDALKNYWLQILVSINQYLKEEYAKDIDLPGMPLSSYSTYPENVGLVQFDVAQKTLVSLAEAYMEFQMVNERNSSKKRKNESEKQSIGISAVEKPNYFDILELTATDPQELFDKLMETFKNKKIKDTPMFSENIIIASGGLYIDSIVGINPATEKYSETMRELEAIRVKTEIEKQEALTDELRARTNLVLRDETFITHIFQNTDTPAGGSTKYYVHLHLSKAVEDASYKVYLSDKEVLNLTLTLQGNKKVIIITWIGQPPAISVLEKDLTLVHNVTGKILRKF